MFRLGRPHPHLEEDGRGVLFAACKPEKDEEEAFNIHFKVELAEAGI
jgi:hypothetical protein